MLFSIFKNIIGKIQVGSYDMKTGSLEHVVVIVVLVVVVVKKEIR